MPSENPKVIPNSTKIKPGPAIPKGVIKSGIPKDLSKRNKGK